MLQRKDDGVPMQALAAVKAPFPTELDRRLRGAGVPAQSRQCGSQMFTRFRGGGFGSRCRACRCGGSGDQYRGVHRGAYAPSGSGSDSGANIVDSPHRHCTFCGMDGHIGKYCIDRSAL